MSELPPPTPPESEPEDKWPEDFVRPTPDEFAKYAGGPRYHSYESYDERAGAQAEREYAEGDTGAEPSPDVPDDTPSPDDSPSAPDDDRPTTYDDKLEEREKIIREAAERAKRELEEKARLAPEIAIADKIIGRRDRAKALRQIAEEHGSIEAAEKILNKRRHFRNPLRFPGSDTSEHDRALEAISKKGIGEEKAQLAAEKIKRGKARNRALGNVALKISGRGDSEGALDISNDMSGPSKKQHRESVIHNIALNYGNKDESIGLVAEELKRGNLSSRGSDRIISDIAVKYRDESLIEQIRSITIRNKTRKKLSSEK